MGVGICVCMGQRGKNNGANPLFSLFFFFVCVVYFPAGKIKSYQFRDRGARFTATQTSEKAEYTKTHLLPRGLQ